MLSYDVTVDKGIHYDPYAAYCVHNDGKPNTMNKNITRKLTVTMKMIIYLTYMEVNNTLMKRQPNYL